MRPLSKGRHTEPATWAKLGAAQRDLLVRLCVPKCDGLFVTQLDAPTRRIADTLLVWGLVTWRDANLRVTPAGLRLVVEDSGRWRKAVGT